MWLSTIYVVFLLFLHESGESMGGPVANAVPSENDVDTLDPSVDLMFSGISAINFPNEAYGYSYEEAMHGLHPFSLKNFPRNPCAEILYVGSGADDPTFRSGLTSDSEDGNLSNSRNTEKEYSSEMRNPYLSGQRRLLMYSEDENLSNSRNTDENVPEMPIRKKSNLLLKRHSRRIRSLQDPDHEEMFKYLKLFNSAIRESYVPVYVDGHAEKLSKYIKYSNLYKNISANANLTSKSLKSAPRSSEDKRSILQTVPELNSTTLLEDASSVYCSFDTKHCLEHEMASCYRMINGLFGISCVDNSKNFLSDIIKKRGLNPMSLEESTKKCINEISSKCSKLTFSCTMGHAADIAKSVISRNKDNIFCKTINSN